MTQVCSLIPLEDSVSGSDHGLCAGQVASFLMIHSRMGGEEVSKVVAGPGGERETVINRELFTEQMTAPLAVDGLIALPDFQLRATSEMPEQKAQRPSGECGCSIADTDRDSSATSGTQCRRYLSW